jgi:IclR family transcriptional regulator, KDG regulon repressor
MSSLKTGLAVLSLFSEARKRWRVCELAAELKLPKSSASRLLATLAEHGFLERSKGAPGFEIGRGVARLGNLYHPQDAALQLADDALDGLVRQYPVTGYLAHLVDEQVQILRTREGAAVTRHVVPEGALLPAPVTAIGKAQLTRLPDTELLARLPERLCWPAWSYRNSRHGLFKELQLSRARGWTDLHRSTQRGIGAFAVTVGAGSARPIGIALCYVTHQVDNPLRTRMLNGLMESAQRIDGAS